MQVYSMSFLDNIVFWQERNESSPGCDKMSNRMVPHTAICTLGCITEDVDLPLSGCMVHGWTDVAARQSDVVQVLQLVLPVLSRCKQPSMQQRVVPLPLLVP